MVSFNPVVYVKVRMAVHNILLWPGKSVGSMYASDLEELTAATITQLMFGDLLDCTEFADQSSG